MAYIDDTLSPDRKEGCHVSPGPVTRRCHNTMRQSPLASCNADSDAEEDRSSERTKQDACLRRCKVPVLRAKLQTRIKIHRPPSPTLSNQAPKAAVCAPPTPACQLRSRNSLSVGATPPRMPFRPCPTDALMGPASHGSRDTSLCRLCKLLQQWYELSRGLHMHLAIIAATANRSAARLCPRAREF